MSIRKLPKNVASVLKAVRAAYGHYVEIKIIKGTFCLFEATSRYNPELKKSIKETTYIGWITPEGLVVPARHHKKKPVNGNRKEEEESKDIGDNYADENAGLGKYDKDILMALSMNSRITVKALTKILGIKSTAIDYHIKKLEKRFAIRYTADIDVRKLGYSMFFLFIKFSDEKPKGEDLRKVLEEHPEVQFAALTEGKFDVIAYLTAESTNLYTAFHRIFTEEKIKKYDAEFTITPAYIDYGLIPMRDLFFDKALQSKVWHKKRGIRRTNEILERERQVMREVVVNGGIDLSEIDKRYDLGHGAANYTFKKLKEEGVIIRETISMRALPYRNIRVMLINIINAEDFTQTRDSLLSEIIKYNGPVNKYAFVADISAPYGTIMFQPVIDEHDSTVDEIKENVRGIRIETLAITEILVGELAFMRMDNIGAPQYVALVEHKVITAEPIIDYESS